MTTTWGATVCKALGIMNIIDTGMPIGDFILGEMAEGSPDKTGNFIDKYLAETKVAKQGSR
jgi:hypothetical protein